MEKQEKRKSKQVKTIEAVGSVFFCQAEVVSKALKDFGVAQLISTDEKDKWLLFKVKNDNSSCMRLGDVFMIDVPGIDKKYEARKKKTQTTEEPKK